MRHVKSNLNILKPSNNMNLNIKPSKSNSNFKKSSTTLQIIDQNANTKTINNNICNLFNKTCKNSEFSSIVFKNYKGASSPNKIYDLNRKSKAYKNNYSSKTIFNNNSNSANRGISIRLNFKNKIINNYFTKRNKINKSKTNINGKLKNLNINNNNCKVEFNLNERIKEKDKQITLLQKDLLQSQKLLNQLQEEKQREISSTYSTINYNSSINSNRHGGMTKYSSLSDFFARNTKQNLRINILKTVYGRKRLSSNKSKSNSKKNIYSSRSKNKFKSSKKKDSLNLFINTSSIIKFHLFNNTSQNTNKNCKTRNNIHKNYNNDNFHSGTICSTNKKNKNYSSPKFMKFFSSSPNKILTQYMHRCDSKSKTIKKSMKKKSCGKFKNLYNNYNGSPYSAQNTINYKRIENKVDSNNNNINDNIDKDGAKSKELIYMMNKGEDLLKRTKKLLGYYIILTDQIKELTEKKNEI